MPSNALFSIDNMFSSHDAMIDRFLLWRGSSKHSINLLLLRFPPLAHCRTTAALPVPPTPLVLDYKLSLRAGGVLHPCTATQKNKNVSPALCDSIRAMLNNPIWLARWPEPSGRAAIPRSSDDFLSAGISISWGGSLLRRPTIHGCRRHSDSDLDPNLRLTPRLGLGWPGISLAGM